MQIQLCLENKKIYYIFESFQKEHDTKKVHNGQSSWIKTEREREVANAFIHTALWGRCMRRRGRRGVWGKWIWRSGCSAECRGFGAGRSEEAEWEESAAPDNPLCYTPNGNSRSRPCLGAHRRTSRGSVGTKIQGQIERKREWTLCILNESAQAHGWHCHPDITHAGAYTLKPGPFFPIQNT